MCGYFHTQFYGINSRCFNAFIWAFFTRVLHSYIRIFYDNQHAFYATTTVYGRSASERTFSFHLISLRYQPYFYDNDTFNIHLQAERSRSHSYISQRVLRQNVVFQFTFYVEAKLIIPQSSYISWCSFDTENIRCFHRIYAHFMPCWRFDIISFIIHYFAITI